MQMQINSEPTTEAKRMSTVQHNAPDESGRMIDWLWPGETMFATEEKSYLERRAGKHTSGNK
jgi:hypothetical protein